MVIFRSAWLATLGAVVIMVAGCGSHASGSSPSDSVPSTHARSLLAARNAVQADSAIRSLLNSTRVEALRNEPTTVEDDRPAMQCEGSKSLVQATLTDQYSPPAGRLDAEVAAAWSFLQAIGFRLDQPGPAVTSGANPGANGILGGYQAEVLADTSPGRIYVGITSPCLPTG